MKLRQLFAALLVAGAFLGLTRGVSASEGTAQISNESVSCNVTSIWEEETYRVLGRCAGLVYPYQTQYEHYFLWAHDVSRNTLVRVGEIERGVVRGNVEPTFDWLLITSEQDNNPRRPSEIEIASGDLIEFTFSEDVVTEETVTTTEQRAETMTVQDASEEESESTAGSILGRILTALFTIVLIAIALVVIGSLVFRRRGSVSS